MRASTSACEPAITRCAHAVMGPKTPTGRCPPAVAPPRGGLFRNGLPNVLRREPDFLAELDELLLGHRLADVAVPA
jgi:hypothetical protein